MLDTLQIAPKLLQPDRAGCPLAQLANEAAAACLGPQPAMAGQIMSALRAAVAAPNLLTAEQTRGQEGCYARHLLYADPKGLFSIISIVWGAGQFSPVHAHHTWCGYAVLTGGLTETLFTFDIASQQAIPLSTHVRRAGYASLSFSGLDQIHRLGNAGEQPAISIHIYGVDGARVGSDVNRVIEPRQ